VSAQQAGSSAAPSRPEGARPRASWTTWVGAALGLLVLALAAWGLKKISGQVTIDDVIREINSTPAHLIVFAAASTFFSYVVLVGYDWFATRHLGYKISWPTLAAASFSSFTMSHTLGVTILTGGTVRYRIYTREGVRPADIAMIILLCGWTFWLGIIFVAGVGLVVSPTLMPQQLREWAPPAVEEFIGALFLGGVALYTALASTWRREFRLWRYRFTIPGGKETLQQIAIGTIDLAFAGGALYLLLLPVAGVPDLLTFLVIYAVAMVSGALAHAPGGIGVFELVIVGLMPDADKAGVLAAVALFRLMYTFVPFVLGAGVLATLEWRALKKARAAAALPAVPASAASEA
jgi:uncharacterized membrane protein YbhN (UPF0104 family)